MPNPIAPTPNRPAPSISGPASTAGAATNAAPDLDAILAQNLNEQTPEDDVAAVVDAVKRSPHRRDLLVDLLNERHPVYRGRGANATMRLRGYVLAAFKDVGLPEAALPYVLEELESGRDAYLVAAAARALRGATPSARWLPFLFKAIENVELVDDAVTFAQYKPRWPLAERTTALDEIGRAIEAIDAAPAPNQPCCCGPSVDVPFVGIVPVPASGPAPAACCAGAGTVAAGVGPATEPAPARVLTPGETVPVDVELQDQDGHVCRFGDLFCRTPSIVAFFYTRCGNPNKCSLTVTKLATLQGAVREAGLAGRLRLAAITYDPAYDSPARLKAYGHHRGVVFGDDVRFLRTLDAETGFATLEAFFDLGVGFGPALVNRHRIELYVLDAAGRVAFTFARLQWDEREVFDCAKLLAGTATGA